MPDVFVCNVIQLFEKLNNYNCKNYKCNMKTFIVESKFLHDVYIIRKIDVIDWNTKKIFFDFFIFLLI